MYVSIDCDNMRFLHKHHDVTVVCNLVHIEAPHVVICVTPYDIPSFLEDFTDMELLMLYRNTTGHDHTSHSGSALRAVLAELAERLPVTDVNAFEVERQAAFIPEGNEEPMKYVRGATRPGKPAELFPLQAQRNPDEDVVAAAKLRAPQRPAPVANSSAAPAPAARPQRPAAPPRKGGVRGTIWEVADSMWEKEGKPTAKAEVLALRKRMMEVLETDHGVKRTSSSNELGNWQKARIP